ncbi:hypothetical protein QR680_005525 [Steinernema hermaphroditum]|uniref:Uncharacterized protein n=1 Tax=Steinernema hermaphroditum TaxID=289476 RepID=A0AA39LVT2_9BILA|nr:hypothetical protein QR680_005525 [Steinernema hermaphroditum]
MGKRSKQVDNGVAAELKSPKKRQKKAAEPEPEEEECFREKSEDVHDVEGSGDDAGLPELKTSQLPPMEMYKFCKNLVEQNENEKHRKGNSILKESDAQLYPGSYSDLKQIQHELRRYYREAVVIGNVSFSDVCKTIADHIAQPDYVTKLPNFPAGRRGLPSKELTALYNKNAEEKNECDEEAKKMELAYIDQLRQFLHDNEELLPEHSQYVQSKIVKLVKKHEAKKPKNNDSPTKKAKKGTKAKMTAFDYFKQSKKNKYTDLDEETREAKLRKKFEKLGDDVKSVYEELEANQA